MPGGLQRSGRSLVRVQTLLQKTTNSWSLYHLLICSLFCRCQHSDAGICDSPCIILPRRVYLQDTSPFTSIKARHRYWVSLKRSLRCISLTQVIKSSTGLSCLASASSATSSSTVHGSSPRSLCSPSSSSSSSFSSLSLLQQVKQRSRMLRSRCPPQSPGIRFRVLPFEACCATGDQHVSQSRPGEQGRPGGRDSFGDSERLRDPVPDMQGVSSEVQEAQSELLVVQLVSTNIAT